MEPDTTIQADNPNFGQFNFFQMIGAPKEVDSDTSETSSYCSSRNPDSDVDADGHEEKPKVKEINLEIMEEHEIDDDRTSTYKKFKTQNEQDLE